MPSDVLYEDDYCELTEDTLTIKRYFLPMLKPKVINVRDVRIVYFEDQTDGKYALRRTWGRAPNDVYWAVDFRRCLPGDKHGKTDIVIDVEDGVRKGFTVKDAQTFLSQLRYVASMGIIVVDNLNLAPIQ
ncbi:Protein R08A2.7 [Aphelenchoides avenae]|nr:Protein R08A2.7 [Aphelenchus avenae]KAH7694336.1 Protein R08A2.7 [Aphelenchus avenae]